jgi:formylglycine-generating enzyme required for sulfatase activity
MAHLTPNQLYHNRYKLLELIGTGGYSEVWHASDTKTGGIEVALKIFAPDKGIDPRALKVFSDEFAITFGLSHPNLLKPIYYDECERSPFLVLPYCKAGAVTYRAGEMTEADLARFLQQAASALAYLHSQYPPIIHQDIKPDNFLIDNQGNYLLSDFGISSKIRRTLTRSMGAQGSTGTMAYMPPEKFSANKQIIKAGDIFSLGVTMYELLTGDLPFGDNGGLTLKAGADVPNLPTGFSSELNELFKRCMAKEPWERPTSEALQRVAQNYFSSGSWQRETVLIDDLIESEIPEKPPQRPTQPIDIKLGSALEKAIAADEFTVFFKQAGTQHDETRKSYFYTELIKKWGQIGFDEFDQAFLLQLTEYKNKRPTTLYISEADMEFIWVEGGTFMMGSDNAPGREKTVHQVTLEGFYMGKTPVTQKQWKRIMGNNPSYFKGEDLPVESVSWNDAQKYIERLNHLIGRFFRLPTEAEWEYAAGGGENERTIFAGTNSKDRLINYAWYKANFGKRFWKSGRTQPVATKLTNRLNLSDMSGNVNEWCSDWFGNYSFTAQTNPKGPPTGSTRVFRGGSWDRSPANCHVANRTDGAPDGRSNNLGFRVALAL